MRFVLGFRGMSVQAKKREREKRKTRPRKQKPKNSLFSLSIKLTKQVLLRVPLELEARDDREAAEGDGRYRLQSHQPEG